MKKFLADSALTRFKNMPGRNTFDRSKKHFASYNLGKIYPMYCQHLQPNETLKIRPSQAFDLEPMNHELYNDMKCNTAWFKVYTRSLWSNYRAFSRLDPTKDSPTIVHPYIANTSDWATVGSLANHLGIPVATYGIFDGNAESSFKMPRVSVTADYTVNSPYYRHFVDEITPFLVNGSLQPYVTRDFSKWQIVDGATPCFMPVRCGRKNNSLISAVSQGDKTLLNYLNNNFSSNSPGILLTTGFNTLISDHMIVTLPHIGSASDFELTFMVFAGSSLEDAKFIYSDSLPYSSNPGSLLGKWYTTNTESRTAYPNPSTPNGVTSPLKLSFTTTDIVLSFTTPIIKSIQALQQSNSYVTILITTSSTVASSISQFGPIGSFAGDYSLLNSSDTDYTVVNGFYGTPTYTAQKEVNQVTSSPFTGSSPSLPINALPFRAYRNIYNSHFRDLIHDPLRDGNGNIMVDQYVENMGDGADSTTSLDFEYCRFEPDLFNTCLPTPTMGDDVNRPLVGITTNAEDNTATLNYHADGKAYSIDVTTSQNGSQTTITGLASTHSESNDNLTIMTLKDAIQYGISLQDLENVRALTKWYEAVYKGKGRFSYNKFIEAQFGKEPGLNENLAAEYLGGDTVYVNSMRVVNQTSGGPLPLGQTGGMADFRAKNDAISVYADEDCYIMGVVWFTCDNVNSQSIDPMWYMAQPADYAVPLFADLGVAPILNKVVAPLQCDSSKYNDVFGYQRIYGDKIYSFDTVAGDFINLKSDYLMQRRFDAMPTLTADLSKMHPDDFTNVFCMDNSYDKIYGRWYFDVTISTWLQQVPNAQII